jgi:NADH-quinone oxidoreductase subunit L
LPLVLLAIPSVVIGFMTIGPMLFGDFFKDAIFVNSKFTQAMEVLGAGIPWSGANGNSWLDGALSGWLCLASYWPITCTWSILLARRNQGIVFADLQSAWTTSTTWTGSMRTYLARGARALGIVLWKAGDQTLIDGACVNGSWKLSAGFRVVRKVQTGLPVPLRTGHGAWHLCADDVFRLAQIGEI